MAFVILGLLLIVLNLLGIGFAAAWQWPGDAWKMLWPFGLAVLWWAYADKSGLTKRREMDKMDRKRELRRQKNMEALGIDARRRAGADKARRAAAGRPSAPPSKGRDGG